MGNAHVFRHRLPAIGAAGLATVAAVLLTVAGTSCSFMDVTARAGQLIEISQQNSQQVYLSSLSIGVLCEGDYYSRSGDTMWEISRIFWIISVSLGFIIFALIWAVSFLVPPKDSNWKLTSVLSALTAVLQMPIFLMFEAQPCSKFSNQQSCSVSTGSYLLIASTVFWILLTLYTQFVEVPRWAIELNAWRVQKEDEEHVEAAPRSQRLVLSDEYGEEDMNPGSGGAKAGFLGLRQWHRRRRWAGGEQIGMTTTESASRDEEEGGMEPFPESQSYYADSNNSRLLLKVLPDGKRPGDDKESAASFGDLDDFSMQEASSMPSSPRAQPADQSMLGAESSSDEEEPELLEGLETKNLAADDVTVPATSTQQPPGDIFAALTEEASDLESDSLPQTPKQERKALLKTSPEDEGESEPNAGQGVIAIGAIRALTNRMKRDHKTKDGKSYAAMDDEESQHYSPPSSPLPLPTSGNEADDEGEIPVASAAPSTVSRMDDSDAVSSLESSEKRARKVLSKDWNALHAAATSGVALSHDDSSDSEDEPEPVYYSSDETRSLVSLSSLGNIPDDEEEDDSSLSSSSYSDSSDGEGIRRRGRRRRRGSRRLRTFSCGESVSSRTSVIEYTINEETDLDLEEIEEGGVGADPYPLQRTQSAPEPYRSTTDGPYDLSHVDSYPTKLRIRSIEEESGESSVLRLASVPITVECHNDREPLLSPLVSGDGTPPLAGGFGSGRQQKRQATADQESSLYQRKMRRGRSMSVPRSRFVGTPDEDDRSVSSQPNCPTPWRDDLDKAGIHCEINIVSSDESSMSDKSARTSRSNISRRARQARIQRLQRETESTHEMKRRRSRTLDPPRRRGFSPARIHNVVSPSLNLILVERETGVDYGPDEASL